MKTFAQYISSSILEDNEFDVIVDEIKYGSPTKEQKDRMNKPLKYFSSDILDMITMGSPPSNSSDLTKKELFYLLKLIDNRTEEDAEKFDKYDEHFSPHFINYAKENSLDFNEEEIRDIRREAANVILVSKFHFNRPRPHQLGVMFGTDIRSMDTESGHTPAYPSGHAAQSRLMALILSDRNPDHKEQLIKLADDVALSRELGGVHYPSDNDFGKKVGDMLFSNLMREDYPMSTNGDDDE
tara:strand:- start:653 stop:1372 length:720 start_codon:yes stop_codon:yes gene_type:complete